MTGVAPLFVVAVCYRLSPVMLAQRLQQALTAVGRTATGVVVCNSSSQASVSPLHALRVLPGSNKQLDFSGYLEGLAYLKAEHLLPAHSNVLFVNDSLFYKHAYRVILQRLLSLDSVLSQLQVPAMAGKLDPYRTICLKNPWSHQSGYMTTFCFLLNSSALDFLARLPTDAERDGVLNDAALKDSTWGAGVDAALREQIRAHVVYRDSPLWWEGTDSNSPELARKKAICAYFEHRLSGAIGLHGALLPLNAGPRAKFLVTVSEGFARLLKGRWSPSA